VLFRSCPIKINMVIGPDTTDRQINAMALFCVENGLTLQTIARFILTEHKRGAGDPATTHRPPDCAQCNRLRLTSDGYLKPCLFSDKEIKINFENIEESFRAAINTKPACGISCQNRSMNQVGG
jgi:GTP 3',8-cyclase